MIRTALLVMLCAVLPGTVALAQDDSSDDNSSALVTLAPLQKGTLPINITSFGKAMPSGSARETITAPVASQVTSVRVQVGQTIAKGTALLTLVPGPETRAAYQSAELDQKLAAQLVERDQQMVKSHLQTQAELAKAENDLAAAKTKLQVLTEEGAAGPNTLKAPFDAIVIKDDAASGALVQRGDALVELARPNGLVVEAGIDPAQALRVKAGDSVALAPLSAGAQSIEGKVALRSAVVDPGDGLVPVQISFPPGKLLVGETVRATITIGENSGYIVPHEAVLVNDDGSTFVVQNQKLTAKKVTVSVLGSDGSKDVVEGKLDPKLEIVVTGGHQVDNGDKLRVAQAAGADANGKAGK